MKARNAGLLAGASDITAPGPPAAAGWALEIGRTGGAVEDMVLERERGRIGFSFRERKYERKNGRSFEFIFISFVWLLSGEGYERITDEKRSCVWGPSSSLTRRLPNAFVERGTIYSLESGNYRKIFF